jgi:hypothetical protein
MQNNKNISKQIYVFCLNRLLSASAPGGDSGLLWHSSAFDPDPNSGIPAHLACLYLLVRFALYFEPRRSLRQRLPTLGQLAFPSKLLRRFLRGCVVFTAHGLVIAPAGVYVNAETEMIWMNRIVARVMSGFVMREEGQLQAAAAHRIAGKSGVFAAARSGAVADVLNYLVADANCVNERDR